MSRNTANGTTDVEASLPPLSSDGHKRAESESQRALRGRFGWQFIRLTAANVAFALRASIWLAAQRLER
jgi:hypothetical protein